MWERVSVQERVRGVRSRGEGGGESGGERDRGEGECVQEIKPTLPHLTMVSVHSNHETKQRAHHTAESGIP